MNGTESLGHAPTLRSVPPTRPSTSLGRSVDPHSPEARLGARVHDRYELRSVIGSGGMGAVYRAFDHSALIEVAVKILHPQFARDRQAVLRFEREAAEVKKLRHPGIVRMHDYGEDPRFGAYMVMELLVGESVDAAVARNPLAVDTAVGIALAGLEALDYAHRNGVIHRDVKPSNLFLAEAPKLLDFGIARVLEDESELTRSGIAMGTPRYMSPEQLIDAKRAEATADVYSMGAALFEMLTGESPADADNQAAMIIQVATGRIRRRPDRLRPEIPAAVGHAIEQALAFDPEERPPTAAAFGRLLEEALTDASTPSHPEPVPARRGSYLLSAVAGALTSLLLVGAFLLAPDAETSVSLNREDPAPTMRPVPDVVSFSGSATATRRESLAEPTASTPAPAPAALSSASQAPRALAPAPRSTRRPAATPAPASSPATPTQQQMNVALQRIQPRVAACTEGELEMRFEALVDGSTGRVSDSVVASPGANQAELACLYRAVAQYRLPPFDGTHRVRGGISVTSG
ncbi:MAG: serine/threonine-protein kinase [Myxococcota bacterium]